MTLRSQVNNPIENLKTGKRRKKGRPKGKFNYRCVDCNRYFHVAPAHMGKTKRCHKCRKGMVGRDALYRTRHTCPLCEGYKASKSNICRKCWDSGRRWDELRRQEK